MTPFVIVLATVKMSQNVSLAENGVKQRDPRPTPFALRSHFLTVHQFLKILAKIARKKEYVMSKERKKKPMGKERLRRIVVGWRKGDKKGETGGSVKLLV